MPKGNGVVDLVWYCRVSTNKKSQESSFENQKEFFETFARLNGYNIIGVYADKGITGVRIKSRDELLRLLEDSSSGEFASSNKWMSAIKKFQNENELSRDMVVELIQKIEVKDYNIVTIVWNFRDEYQALANLADNGEADIRGAE